MMTKNKYKHMVSKYVTDTGGFKASVLINAGASLEVLRYVGL